jgi:hypothetical protein
VFGAGDALRALAVPQELGIRRSDGRWLMRSTTGHMVTDRFGDPVILVPRAAVIDALAARVPDGVLSLGTEVTCGGRLLVRVCRPAGSACCLAPVYGWQPPAEAPGPPNDSHAP